MIEEKRISDDKHTITMENREKVSITGVIDVLSFDEESVVCDTELGLLILRGEGLHVNKLNLDHGELNVDGEVNAIEYSESNGLAKGRGSFFSKIFK